MDFENRITEIRNAFPSWTFEYECCGIVTIFHDDKPVYVNATPYWEGDEGISIEVNDINGDGIITPYSCNFDDTFDGYISAMKKELKNIEEGVLKNL